MFGNIYNVALTAFLVFSGLLLISAGRWMLRNASQLACAIESQQARFWGGERNETRYFDGWVRWREQFGRAFGKLNLAVGVAMLAWGCLRIAALFAAMLL